MKLHIAALVVVMFMAILDLQAPTKYEQPSPDARTKAVRQLTLSFSGDVIQHMPQLAAASNGDGTYDFSRTFAYIDTVWESVDFAIINYETTVSTNGKYTGFPCFSAPSDVAQALYDSGIRIMALANNHSCDKGFSGMEKTITTLEQIGFKTTGTYTDSSRVDDILMLNKGRFRVALLNYTYGTNGIPIPKGATVNLIDTIQMRQDIDRARIDSTATHVIAFMHWGVEYQRKANKEQQMVGMWCRENGVDVVIGSHPHVVQDIDTVNRIVYSLGNFISNQQDQYTDSGLTVIVKLEHHADPVIEFIPHWCDKTAIVHKEKYRVLRECDTILYMGANLTKNLTKMKKALNEARQAVGDALESRQF